MFLAAKWYIAASMTGVHLSYTVGTFVVDSSGVESFPIGRMSNGHSARRYLTACGGNPAEVLLTEDLARAECYLLTAVGNVRYIFIRHYFGRNQVTILVGTAYVDSSSVNVVSPMDGASGDSATCIPTSPVITCNGK